MMTQGPWEVRALSTSPHLSEELEQGLAASLDLGTWPDVTGCLVPQYFIKVSADFVARVALCTLDSLSFVAFDNISTILHLLSLKVRGGFS